MTTQESVYFVHIEDKFGTITRVHITTGHGGIYKRYSRCCGSVQTFVCLVSKELGKKWTVKLNLSKDFHSRAQVKLLDIQSCVKGMCEWIMVYQDHRTKYCILRPLTSKRVPEAAIQLMDIFLMFGAPQTLQNDNGSDFIVVVKSL